MKSDAEIEAERAELEAVNGPTRAGWYAEACRVEYDAHPGEATWACRYREMAAELYCATRAIAALAANLRRALWCLENPGVPPTPDALDNVRAALALGDRAALILTDEPETPSPKEQMMAFEKPTIDQLAHRFVYHAPVGDQVERYANVRHAIKQAAITCVGLTPCSPEQTRALNALDDAMFLFNAAIARNEPPRPA